MGATKLKQKEILTLIENVKKDGVELEKILRTYNYISSENLSLILKYYEEYKLNYYEDGDEICVSTLDDFNDFIDLVLETQMNFNDDIVKEFKEYFIKEKYYRVEEYYARLFPRKFKAKKKELALNSVVEFLQTQRGKTLIDLEIKYKYLLENGKYISTSWTYPTGYVGFDYIDLAISNLICGKYVNVYKNNKVPKSENWRSGISGNRTVFIVK